MLNQNERELIVDIGKLSRDPYRWVLFAFPWGEGELKDFKGPEDWQKDILLKMRDGLLTINQALQAAVSSGHGVGKSCLVSWIILWGLSTFEDTKGVVTANTETQLKTKTWPELAKWHRLFIAKHWFTLTATAIYSSNAEHEKTWRIDMVPWSQEKTEAFAGLHNKGKRIILIFDEASAIPDPIWEVSEGALTDEKTEIIWCVFGNPTRNNGRFHDCFNKFRHRWITKQVDSRAVTITNKTQIHKWVEDYGEDSDFVRVRVRGVFPNASDRQLIPSSFVEEARMRKLEIGQFAFAPKILTCDPAWTGGDETVIGLRQGLMYKQLAIYPKNDNDLVMAGYLANFEDKEKADAVFIDMGFGTGIYSAGQSMGRNWTLVAFGSESNTQGYKNKRAEMWGLMKDWLRQGGCVPDDPMLLEEITGPEYEVNLKGETVLESKDDMKKRGLRSPNRADTLALSFAHPIAAKGKSRAVMHPRFSNQQVYSNNTPPHLASR